MKNSQQHHNSLGFFNRIRGLGVIWIIIGHSFAQYMTTKTAAEAAAIPVFAGAGRVLGGGILAMFFLISGFYFYRRSPKKCFSTQKKLILRPYIMTSMAIILVKALISVIAGRFSWKNTVSYIVTYALGLNVTDGRQVLGITLKTISIFWFLLALFGGWVLYNAIVHLKDKRMQTVAVVSCVVCSWILTKIFRTWPFALPAVLLAVGYIAAGHYIHQKNLLERKLPKWMWCVISSFALISIVFGYSDIASGVWKLGLLDVAGSFCVGFLLLRLYAYLTARCGNSCVLQVVEKIGLYSMWILCLHAFEKEVINWKRLLTVLPGRMLLCGIICFVGRCVVIYLLYIGFSRIRMLYHSKRRKKITFTEE